MCSFWQDSEITIVLIDMFPTFSGHRVDSEDHACVFVVCDVVI